jgi:hypothetical protein
MRRPSFVPYFVRQDAAATVTGLAVAAAGRWIAWQRHGTYECWCWQPRVAIGGAGGARRARAQGGAATGPDHAKRVGRPAACSAAQNHRVGAVSQCNASMWSMGLSQLCASERTTSASAATAAAVAAVAADAVATVGCGRRKQKQHRGSRSKKWSVNDVYIFFSNAAAPLPRC